MTRSAGGWYTPPPSYTLHPYTPTPLYPYTPTPQLVYAISTTSHMGQTHPEPTRKNYLCNTRGNSSNSPNTIYEIIAHSCHVIIISNNSAFLLSAITIPSIEKACRCIYTYSIVYSKEYRNIKNKYGYL